ncbi:hypothetical protein FB451DRAFT_1236354 [Mycena latifolia]|nr:hypothetical protein FB451DRAFT_1236354 [Mycena latifolia]
MLFPLTVVLSSLFLPAACQSLSGGDDVDFSDEGFHPDALTSGIFALLCIYAVAYSVLIIWTFVALVTGRGHRSPYAFLLPTLVFFAWSNAAYIGIIIIENIPAVYYSDSLPVMLLPSLRFVSNLFNDWAAMLQFLAVIAVIWNRETTLRVATEGKFGGHHPALITLHVTLASLIFALGTAAEAYNMDTTVQYYVTRPDDLRFLRGELHHRIIVYQQLFYAFSSFAILSAIDVVVSSVLLWRAWKKAAIPDKATNIVLYALAPLYAALSLMVMIFTIIFSPSGLPNSVTLTTFEGASLASTLLPTVLSFAVITTILVLSLKKANWNAGGVADPPKQQYWAPQPQYMYAAPPQPGYYPQGAQPMQYAPQDARPGSYIPGSPPSMHATPGSYTPPQSVSSQGQPVQQVPEKSGFHLA